jgi:hypothetical protein
MFEEFASAPNISAPLLARKTTCCGWLGLTIQGNTIFYLNFTEKAQCSVFQANINRD